MQTAYTRTNNIFPVDGRHAFEFWTANLCEPRYLGWPRGGSPRKHARNSAPCRFRRTRERRVPRARAATPARPQTPARGALRWRPTFACWQTEGALAGCSATALDLATELRPSGSLISCTTPSGISNHAGHVSVPYAPIGNRQPADEEVVDFGVQANLALLEGIGRVGVSSAVVRILLRWPFKGSDQRSRASERHGGETNAHPLQPSHTEYWTSRARSSSGIPTPVSSWTSYISR